MNPDSYESLALKRINALPIVCFHIEQSFKDVHSRLRKSVGPRNPWKFSVKQSIHADIFLEFFKAVKYYSTKHGFTVSSKTGRHNLISAVTITFTHLGSLKRHLSRLGVDTSLLTKSLRDSCTAEGLLVSRIIGDLWIHARLFVRHQFPKKSAHLIFLIFFHEVLAL